VIFQKAEESIELGEYSVVFWNADTRVVQLDFFVSFDQENNIFAYMDNEKESSFYNLLVNFTRPFIDDNNHVVVELAQFIREKKGSPYSDTIDEMTIEVFSGAALLGSQIFDEIEYEWYWCRGEECPEVRQNYRAESRMQVDSLPVDNE
jgi:hypothetical protein